MQHLVIGTILHANLRFDRLYFGEFQFIQAKWNAWDETLSNEKPSFEKELDEISETNSKSPGLLFGKTRKFMR